MPRQLESRGTGLYVRYVARAERAHQRIGEIGRRIGQRCCHGQIEPGRPADDHGLTQGRGGPLIGQFQRYGTCRGNEDVCLRLRIEGGKPQRIRAFDPFPGASTTIDGEVIKIWNYEIDSNTGLFHKDFGHVLHVNGSGVTVACGTGALRLTCLQRAGGKRLAVADFLRGFDLQPGMVLGAPPDRPLTTA